MSSEIVVIDDFLPKEKFLPIQKLLLSDEFPWTWAEHTVIYPTDMDKREIPSHVLPLISCEELDNFQFQNVMYIDSLPRNEYLQYVFPVISNLKPTAVGIHRVKANLNPRADRIIRHGMHVDAWFDCMTAVYYLNTNNGYTIFEDGTEIESVENRIVIFPSKIKHTGTTCTDEKRRVVLNINYFSSDI